MWFEFGEYQSTQPVFSLGAASHLSMLDLRIHLRERQYRTGHSFWLQYLIANDSHRTCYIHSQNKIKGLKDAKYIICAIYVTKHTIPCADGDELYSGGIHTSYTLGEYIQVILWGSTYCESCNFLF